MPLPFQYELPAFDNAKEFEDMMVDYGKIAYGHAELYGRRGQCQKGIDILCQTKKGLIAIQCKNYKILSVQNVDEIIEKAKNFESPLLQLIIATTAPRDYRIQDYLLKLRHDNNLFVATEIWFWDEISQKNSDHEHLLKKYYPQLFCNRITPEWLKDRVNEGVFECKILDFIRTNPVDGISRQVISDVGIFLTVMDDYLKKAILLQNDNLFKSIQQFCYHIGYYNQFLSRRMCPSGSMYYAIFETQPQKLDAIKKEIESCRTNIDMYYSEINPGCTML